MKPLDERGAGGHREGAREAAPGAGGGVRQRVRERVRFDNIVGDSPALREVFEVVQRAAPTRANVLILGESGTGKELIAQALHELAAEGPSVRPRELRRPHRDAARVGALRPRAGCLHRAVARREGRFERADGGTIFLDEIGDVSPAVQVKLLRSSRRGSSSGWEAPRPSRSTSACSPRPTRTWPPRSPPALPRGPLLSTQRHLGDPAPAPRPEG